ncbi:hypothetical protein CAPTEDRAFT_188844 [Capitella teleta]|uniref:Uncharacterized protein n=1 Tax=Capitella teleta TaxID=283909 RepID=R7TBP9_CAPTE|nr:hypothetical protein CAPTEDRAFT_188844 [Capitella teleta]|eukprot:ELT88912.1 hypothetical protein CAPTEDRAFT_188844 [Capitella teleta]
MLCNRCAICASTQFLTAPISPLMSGNSCQQSHSKLVQNDAWYISLIIGWRVPSVIRSHAPLHEKGTKELIDWRERRDSGFGTDDASAPTYSSSSSSSSSYRATSAAAATDTPAADERAPLLMVRLENMWQEPASREQEELQALEDGVREIGGSKKAAVAPFKLWNEWSEDQTGSTTPAQLFSRDRPVFQRPEGLLRKSSPAYVGNSGSDVGSYMPSKESQVQNSLSQKTEDNRSCRPKSAKFSKFKGRVYNDLSPNCSEDSSPGSSRPESAASSGKLCPVALADNEVFDTCHNRPLSGWANAMTRRRSNSDSTRHVLVDDDGDDDDDLDGDDSGLDEILYLDDSHQTSKRPHDVSCSENDSDSDQSPPRSQINQKMTIINISTNNQAPAWSTKTLSYQMKNRIGSDHKQVSPDDVRRNRLLQRRRHSDDIQGKADLKQLLKETQRKKKQNGNQVSSEAVLEHAAGKVLDKYRKRAKSDVIQVVPLKTPDRMEEVKSDELDAETQLPRKLQPLRPKSAKCDRPRTRMGQSHQISPDDESLLLEYDNITRSKLTPMASKDFTNAEMDKASNDLDKRRLHPIRSISIDPKPDDCVPSTSQAAMHKGKRRDSIQGEVSPLPSPLAVLAPIQQSQRFDVSPRDSEIPRDIADLSPRGRKASLIQKRTNHLEPALQDFLSRNTAVHVIPTELGPELDDF